MARQAQ